MSFDIDPAKLVKVFSREWPMVRDTPIPFIIAALVGVILTFVYVWPWASMYEQQIADYKERLHEASKETKYTRLTNKELKTEAKRIGQGLRQFQRDISEQEDALTSYRNKQRNPPLSEQQREALLREVDQRQIAETARWNYQFQKDYLGEVRALSTAIYERLPERPSRRTEDALMNAIVNSGFLVGVNPVSNIADNLNELATLLPTSIYDGWFTLRWQDYVFTLALFTLLSLLILRQYALWRRPKPLQPISPPPQLSGRE